MTPESIAVKLTEDNFEEEVLEHPGLVLVEFEATWSGSCKIIASVMSQLSEEFSGRFKLGVLDVDENERLAKEYCIRSLPTLVFFRRGTVVDSIAGVFPRKTIVDKLLFLLDGQDDQESSAGR